MERSRVWPDFDDAWIVHEDDDLLVVDKPDGIPSQAADPARPDDLLTRLRMRRPGDYLGVHQRLDRDTSGVLLMTRRREANGAIASQFEGRKVDKRYVAAVASWPRGRESAVLRDALAPGDGGRMQVVPPKTKGAQEAVTRVRVLERRGDRTLLELVLETGRTHQARVQLAHAGAPIAGDALYGGAMAPRLLLHARSLSLAHPSGGGPVRFEAPVPEEFDAWLTHGDRGASIYDEPAALDRAIARAVRRRFALGHAGEGDRATTAFRLINEGGDALPGLAVDLYGGHVVAQLYADDEGSLWADEARRARVLDRLFAVGFDGVYLKIRPKQANTLVDTRRDDLAPKEPVRGTAAAEPLEVFEEGIPYLVRLGDGLSTGIFLDQRANRRRVRELAGGQSVVNLFAYTCGFSVAAAVGGAWRTLSVDASTAALERGRENMRHAGQLEAAEHTFVADDAFRWLARAKTKGERHDVVVLDPPSYSSTKTRRFVASSDYAELAAAALAILRPGGTLLACSNHRGISPTKFRRALFDAARAAGVEVAQIKDLPDPADYPPPIGGTSHLKSVLVTLGRDEKASKSERVRR
jgi:23S rRNA (cytosine1962-C5)-methyltransferase